MSLVKARIACDKERWGAIIINKDVRLRRRSKWALWNNAAKSFYEELGNYQTISPALTCCSTSIISSFWHTKDQTTTLWSNWGIKRRWAQALIISIIIGPTATAVWRTIIALSNRKETSAEKTNVGAAKCNWARLRKSAIRPSNRCWSYIYH